MSDDRPSGAQPVIDAPTAEELSGELTAVTPGTTSRQRSRERREARLRRRRRRRGVVAVIFALLAAGAAGATWWALGDGDPSVEPKVSGVSITNTVPSTTSTTLPPGIVPSTALVNG